MQENGDTPDSIIEKHGLKQVSDSGEIAKIIQQVIDENPDSVADYRSGKDKLFGFFVGQVMKKTGGKANPNAVNDLLKEALK